MKFLNGVKLKISVATFEFAFGVSISSAQGRHHHVSDRQDYREGEQEERHKNKNGIPAPVLYGKMSCSRDSGKSLKLSILRASVQGRLGSGSERLNSPTGYSRLSPK
ncbi:MAG: hypothetical protein J0M12_16540 [Deltaproteobacteria bacterium]|nr:hypothetical protein [Deltaproteobacteria bacterium]